MKGTRHNEGKPKYSLLPLKELEPVVRVLEHGVNVYGRDNWRKGLDKNEIIDSLMRHQLAYQSGEEIDPESGQHHAAHMVANTIFLLYECTKEE